MAIAITAYEFYGAATGDPLVPSDSKLAISEMSQKNISNPTKLYYDYDIQRPLFNTSAGFVANSMARYISFRITGNYNKIKNVKITITKPALYQKIGGVYTAVTDDTVMTYKLTPVYTQPASITNAFSRPNGAFDGDMNVITGATVVRPKISAASPCFATTRQAEYVYSADYWTEFLVLQANVYPGAFDKVGTFGKQGGTDIGSITGPLITVEVDEVGISTVD